MSYDNAERLGISPSSKTITDRISILELEKTLLERQNVIMHKTLEKIKISIQYAPKTTDGTHVTFIPETLINFIDYSLAQVTRGAKP